MAFGLKKIFSDAKLTINQGDRIGLIGLNGHGKSTLFKVLTEEVKADISTPPFTYDKSITSKDIFLVPQELNTQDFLHLPIRQFYLSFYPRLHEIHQALKKIEEELMSTEDYDKLLIKQQNLLDEFEKFGGWEIENSYLSYLKLFDLQDIERSIEKLSGGEKRKMALSIGLSARAELILWDEPTNHLDIETIEKFEDELTNSRKTFMIISHDRYLLNYVTNVILHIDRGQIITFKGTYLDYLEYLEEKEKELQKNLDKLQNRHRRELAWMRQGIKARGTRSKKRVEGFHHIKDEISKLKSRSKKTVELDLQHSGRKSKILIEIKEATFSYQNKSIFDQLDITVHKKDKIALIGPNGAGKTTLINILRQKLSVSSGHFKSADDLKVLVFEQNREALDLNQTPIEAVGEGQSMLTLGDGKQKHINSYLESFLFTSDQANRPISTLSGGEKNRLQLALFMKRSADLWIFDEPTNDLDIETIELLERELKDYSNAVIIIGHDRAFLDNVCDTTWLVHDKHIEVFAGGYTQVAPYLQALELEREQAQKNQTSQSGKQVDSPIKQGLSNKEKIRWDNIENEIAQAEEKIAKLDAKIAKLDFSAGDAQVQEDFKCLEASKAKAEKTLENLYAEWEDLSSKV